MKQSENQPEKSMKTTTKLPSPPPAYGAPFEGGFYGGNIRMGDALYAVVWAPKARGELKGKWLDSYTDVPNARSCFDSMANTQAMAAAGSDLASQALALSIHGCADWCLPSRDVLELAYRHLKPGSYDNSCSFRDGDNPSSVPAGYPYTDDSPVQTGVKAFQKGNSEAFEYAWYWTSTQSSSDNAWDQRFNHGTQDYSLKSFEGRARAVRLIHLDPLTL